MNIRSTIYQSFFALCLGAFGVSFPFFCGDCGDHPIGGIVVALLCVAGAAFWIRYLVRHAKKGNPVDLQIAAFGNPQVVWQEIEADFVGQDFRTKRLYVGARWICYSRKTDIIVRRIDALIWAYIEKVKHKWNFIPVGTTQQLILWERTGRGAALILNKKRAKEALPSLKTVAPWLLIGYTDVLKESWNNDREDLIAYVDRRRAGNA